MSVMKFALLLGVGLNLVGCNGASFSASPAGSQKPKSNTNRPSNLSCTASPQSFGLGQAVNISVTASSWVNGPVFQRIIGGQTNIDNQLIRSSDQFVVEGGSSNVMTPTTAGTYTVELRLDSAAAAVSTCNFTVDAGTNGGINTPNSIGCDFTNKTVPAGTRLPINVTTNSNYRGGLTQKIQGPAAFDSQLKYDTNRWVRTDNAANAVTLSAVGDYTITYQLTDASEINPTVRSCKITVESQICQDGQASVGAHVAFIVDNSNSNSSTDCPNRRKTGVFNGADTYECQGPTNREQAVISAFEILEGIGIANQGTASAQSFVSIASFPTRQNFEGGYQIETQGWVPAESSRRASIAQSMRFANTPFGLTPYGAALSSATELFRTAPTDGRARIAVLVTDGEPTDRKPIAVIDQANALKASGVEVITIFVTGNETQQQRKAHHADMLNRFNNWSKDNGEGPWYGNNIRSFSEYVEIINGSDQTSDLVSKVSTQIDPNCVEQGGNKCARHIVQITDAANLKTAIENVIRTRAIQCQ